jgi:hypothetical protein
MDLMYLDWDDDGVQPALTDETIWFVGTHPMKKVDVGVSIALVVMSLVQGGVFFVNRKADGGELSSGNLLMCLSGLVSGAVALYTWYNLKWDDPESKKSSWTWKSGKTMSMVSLIAALLATLFAGFVIGCHMCTSWKHKKDYVQDVAGRAANTAYQGAAAGAGHVANMASAAHGHIQRATG